MMFFLKVYINNIIKQIIIFIKKNCQAYMVEFKFTGIKGHQLQR